jgi:hypothetical protein
MKARDGLSCKRRRAIQQAMILPDPAAFRTRDLSQPEVREQLRQLLREAADQPRDHLAWGQICEEAGEPGLALREYQLALRNHPDNAAALQHLVVLYRERGDMEHALSCAKRWAHLDAQNPAALRELVSLYLEDDMAEQALAVLEEGRRRGLPGDTLEALAQAIRAARATQPPEEEVVVSSLVPSDADVARFVHLFSGRENVYARQWCDASGAHGYTPVHQPFTFAVAKNHLLGNITAGIYPVRLDNTVTFLAFDIDINKGALAKARGSASEARRLRTEVSAQAQQFHAALCAFEIAPILEDSGYKGRHLWVFFEEPVEAAIARQFGTLFLATHPVQSRDIHAELFPKQNTAGSGVGNLIKLPLGLHRRTGRRSRLLLPDGLPDPDPFRTLRTVHKLERERLAHLIVELKRMPAVPVSVPSPGEPEEQGFPALPPPPAPRPPWTAADFETNAEIAHLLRHCPVAAALKEKAEKHRRLTHDEQVVLAHSLGHSGAGVLAVNYLFDLCLDVPASARLQTPLSGNPISCPKIRKRIPHVTSRVNCNCSFAFAPDRYPTPRLHLLTLPEPTAPPQAAEPAWNPVESVRTLGLLWERRRQTEKEIAQLEQRLVAHLQQSGSGRIEIEEGALTLKQESGSPPCLVWEPKQPAGQG